MTFQAALDNLSGKYGKYGYDREFLSSQLRDGVMNEGFSVNVAYNGLRMVLAEQTGEHELFSIEDVMEITGESRETIMERIEQCKEELMVAGENPDSYFIPTEPATKKTLFFPGGASDFKP